MGVEGLFIDSVCIERFKGKNIKDDEISKYLKLDNIAGFEN